MKNKFQSTFFYLVILLFTIFTTSCSKDIDYEAWREANNPKPDPLEAYQKMIKEFFVKGFSMKLKQIYVLGENVMTDEISMDSVFRKGSQEIFNIYSFKGSYSQQAILVNRELNEIWKISPKYIFSYIQIIEHGLGRPNENGTMAKSIEWNDITCINSTDKIKFGFQYENSYYTQADGAIFGAFRNFNFQRISSEEIMQRYEKGKSISKYELELTNLRLSIDYFDGETLEFSTNPVYGMIRNYTPPLTSTQVQTEINKGNYEVVNVNSHTTAYKIGENFYIPTGIGNNWKYYGSSNANGLFDQLNRVQYIFYFEII